MARINVDTSRAHRSLAVNKKNGEIHRMNLSTGSMRAEARGREQKVLGTTHGLHQTCLPLPATSASRENKGALRRHNFGSFRPSMTTASARMTAYAGDFEPNSYTTKCRCQAFRHEKSNPQPRWNTVLRQMMRPDLHNCPLVKKPALNANKTATTVLVSLKMRLGFCC